MINCAKFDNPLLDNHMPVLASIFEGKAVALIADELHRPYETVVSQVKRMMSLTGTHKVTEFVRVATLNRWACKDCKKECPFDLHLTDSKPASL